MSKHDVLRKQLDEINNMERGEASHIITEVLKHIMDNIQPERSKREDSFCKICRCLLNENDQCQNCLLDKVLK